MEEEEKEEGADEENRDAGRSAGEAIDCTSVRASRSELADTFSMVGGWSGCGSGSLSSVNGDAVACFCVFDF